MVNNCPKCNTPLKPQARFCHTCGFQHTTSFSGNTPFMGMQKPKNRQRTYAFIWLFVTIAFLIIFILPIITDIDMMDGGGAMIMIGLVMFITGAIVTPFFFKRAKRFDDIVSGKNILAYWVYKANEWNEYTNAEYAKRKNEKWGLFWLISIIAFIVNTIMCIVHPDGILIFVFVQLGIMVLIGISAYLSYTIPYRNNKKNIGKAIIAPNGIYLNGSFHSWKGMSARLDYVQISENNTILEFTYSAMVTYGRRESYTVNVPIPENEISAAFRIVEFFKVNIE